MNAIQAKRDLDNFDSLNEIGRMKFGECDSLNEIGVNAIGANAIGANAIRPYGLCKKLGNNRNAMP